METVAVLRAEHDGILAVLEQLDLAVTAAERGRPVPADVFQDIREFFTIFVDRCHHGKEEAEVFPRIERGPEVGLVRQLEAEHGDGRTLAAAYAAAVDSYQPGDADAAAKLANAARAYAKFLRAHIDEENTTLFRVVERALASQDHAIAEAFERIEVERIGPGTHERLHAMIDHLPDRIAPYLGT